jgi:thiol-disulfide isomerase/thioredoxin
MFWLAAMMVAQVVECPLERELRLPPGGDWKSVVLRAVKAEKGFETWSGEGMELTRRGMDGAIGLKMEGRVVALRAMGLVGVEGVGEMRVWEKGFVSGPVAVRVRRGALGFGAREVVVERSGSWFVGARCGGKLVVSEWRGEGGKGVDVNGDGKVDVNSPAEYARGKGGMAKFAWEGKGYVMEGVDWAKRVMVMRETEVGPEFRVGEVVEDFAYVDRLGAVKRLSEGAEDFTVIDFWASWCGPCIAAFPQLQAMGEQYRVRVLGVNGDEDREAASKVLAQFVVMWPDVQETRPGWLYEYRLRVGLYPTYLLLDRERKIVWRGESTVELLEEVKQRVMKR